ncbi:Myosin, partial [Phytophthora megakarya]
MAADVSARVHLVAEKLQQKAQDAQRKGNDNAARALSSSVSDLRQALALISEQRHLLARRRGEGDDEEDDADAHVQELVARLARVEAMLGKKSDDMKAKGNEGAANALQQSAMTVDKGRALLLEQQQTIFGLLGRWEKLEDVVRGKKCNSDDEMTQHSEVFAKVLHLVQLGEVLGEVFPQCKAEEVKEEVERLTKELELAREEAVETKEMLNQESLALQELKNEMEKMKEREIVRQEEDAALLEQQREACQAMEELVRESDQEIQRMTQSAAARAEEMQSLRIEMESLASEKERLVRVHTDEVEELQGQLESAMDALSAKTDEGEEANIEELKELQVQLDSLMTEKEELVKAHADEIEQLRLQLENATTSLSAKSEENEQPNHEELISLQAEFDNLVAEKEDLVRLNAEEVEQLQIAHTHEIEELRQKLESAVNALSDQSTPVNAEELRLLQAQVDNLTSVNEGLTKSHSDEIEKLREEHSDEIEKLRNAHTSELEDLRIKLESAQASLLAEVEGSEAPNAEELELLKEEINNLRSEKEHLEEAHAIDLETLRNTHFAEIEAVRHQFDNATVDVITETTAIAMSDVDELQQLRAEVGALTIEKDHLVKKHADEIEKLNHQVECAKTDAESALSGHHESDADESEDGEHGDRVDVPVIELEESLEADIAVEDEVETGSNGGDIDFMKASEMQAALDDLRAQLREHEELSQTQRDTISELEREQLDLHEKIEILTIEKDQAVNNLERSHDTEILSLQADLDALQTQIAEYKELNEGHQSTIVALKNEQASYKEQIELLSSEKTLEVDGLQSSHEEETTHLAQRLAESENSIKLMSTQLKELQTGLEDKTAEHSQTSDALGLCETELRSCRSELEAQICECNQLKIDLETIQREEDVKNGEVDTRLSRLTTELQEVLAALNTSDEMNAESVDKFTGTEWQSPEVKDLCNGLSPLLTDRVYLQKQLCTTIEQLNLIRSESDKQKLIVDDFVKTADWRLFAKDGEEEECVMELLDAGKDINERLAVAKTNTFCWLEELQNLRDRVEKDVDNINELKQEKLQTQERVMALEDAKHDLEEIIETLNEKLAAMQKEREEMVKATEVLKVQNHSASIQEQQQQQAQQEEVAQLQQQLVSVRSEFERYRVRSHTALKKMEKRAELLNGMRKENEELLQQVKASDEQRNQANAARTESEARLQEIQRSREMMQADFDQFVTEKAGVITELEEEVQRLESEREQTDTKIEEFTLRIQELEAEKKHIEQESDRIKEAEQTAFQARLNTAIGATQNAKQDLQKVHDALEASKAENEKRQKQIESLELKLEEYIKTPTASTNSAPPVSSLASPSAEMSKDVTGLEKELDALRTTVTALRKQLDDARAELIALQERFATTKAANAEKEFALEEQNNHLQMELDVATEEVRRLQALLEAQTTSQRSQTNGAISVSISSGANENLADVEPKASSMRIQESAKEVMELKAELADANTEISLLTRALDASREELQGARDQIDALAPALSEPESGEDSKGGSKTSAVLLAKDEALKKVRLQVLGLQEELDTIREEKAALELEMEKEELTDLQANRKHMQSEKERAMQLQRRQTLVSSFEKQVSAIVVELQQRLEEHSNAFREVCDFR